MFLGEEKGKRVNVERATELAANGAAVVGTACPFCQTMFRDAFGTLSQTPPRLLDIAQNCGGFHRVRGGAREGIIPIGAPYGFDADVRRQAARTSSGRVAQLAEQVTLNH